MRIKKTTELSDDLHAKRNAIINSVLPDCCRVLEIGPNASPNQYDRKNCEIVTIDVCRLPKPDVIGTAEIMPFRDSSFDFIIATEVIEHVRHPKLMLDELKRLLKSSAKLLISTPNVAHLTNRIGMMFAGDFYDDRTLHHGTDVGHIHFFTRVYFHRVIREHGFYIVKEWDNFIPVTPAHYIECTTLEKILKNLTKQSVVLCTVKK